MCELCKHYKDMRHIVANQMKLPSGKVIRSYSRHDYVSVEEDGVQYMVDGGEEYLRRSLTGEDCSVHSDDDFEVVREVLAWGTYGKNGDEPHKWVHLAEMSDAHIQAILDTQLQVPEWRRALMQEELLYRGENNILIED